MSWRIPHLTSQMSAARRRGVSLLEVLFSIGIVAVGLLGIMVLLPVAGSRLAHGIVADMGDRVGRSAIRQFNVQMMRQPNTWTWYDLNASPQGYVPVPPSPGVSYCIDPLCVATLVDTSAYTPVAGYFPSIAGAAGNPRMYRISLRPTAGVLNGMKQPQAEQAFLYQDDLTVRLPDDRALLPIQNFGTGNVKRQYEGRYSWLATLTPVGSSASNLYVLSIVVFHRRDLGMTLPASSPGSNEPENERMVDVVFPTGTTVALGGGDVMLKTRTNNSPTPWSNPPRPDKDIQLGQGEWIMLMANAAGQPIFKWYRVIAVEPDTYNVSTGTYGPQFDNTTDPTNPFYYRNVTLFGQDWDTTLATQALLMNGVVAVYEKTIRLETSSLWTVQ